MSAIDAAGHKTRRSGLERDFTRIGVSLCEQFYPLPPFSVAVSKSPSTFTTILSTVKQGKCRPTPVGIERKGATRFFRIARASVMWRDIRLTLALTYVLPEYTTLEVLKRLLERLQRLGFQATFRHRVHLSATATDSRGQHLA
jgi:hypothetical protein